MRSRLLVVVLLWVIPGLALAACPYDLHGTTTCSTLPRFGRALGDFITFPGLFLGATMSGALRRTPQEGESFVAFAAGVFCWMVLLSLFVLFAPRLFGSVTSDRSSNEKR
jgi:hypothetical protein